MPNRRDACLQIAAVCLTAAPAGAARWPLDSGLAGLDQRHLWIRQAGQGRESLHVPFRDPAGQPEPHGLRRLAWLFRDWRDADRAVAIDVRLFDLLAGIQTLLCLTQGHEVELVLNSGYRTPRRNATLEGAAANSQHIHGRAADITVPGVAPAIVQAVADRAGAPGLGRYPGFTHVDTGPGGRRWSG